MVMDSTERVEMAELSTSFCKLMIFVESLTAEMVAEEGKEEYGGGTDGGADASSSGVEEENQEDQERNAMTETIDNQEHATCTMSATEEEVLTSRRMTSKLRQRLLPIATTDLEQKSEQQDDQTVDTVAGVDRNYEGKNQEELVRSL